MALPFLSPKDMKQRERASAQRFVRMACQRCSYANAGRRNASIDNVEDTSSSISLRASCLANEWKLAWMLVDCSGAHTHAHTHNHGGSTAANMILPKQLIQHNLRFLIQTQTTRNKTNGCFKFPFYYDQNMVCIKNAMHKHTYIYIYICMHHSSFQVRTNRW